MANKRHIKLNSIRDVQVFISRLINRRLRDEVDSVTSRDCGYLAKILIEAFEKVQFEDEIQKIKEKLGMTDESENRTESH